MSRTSCRSDRPRGGGETTRRNQQVWTATCCRPHCIMGAGPAGVAQDDITRLSRLSSSPSAAFIQPAQSEQEPGRLELRNQILMVLNRPYGSERFLIRLCPDTKMALNARWDLCRAGGLTPRGLFAQKKCAQQGSPETSFVTNEELQSKQLLPVWKSLLFLLSEDVS